MPARPATPGPRRLPAVPSGGSSRPSSWGHASGAYPARVVRRRQTSSPGRPHGPAAYGIEGAASPPPLPRSPSASGAIKERPHAIEPPSPARSLAARPASETSNPAPTYRDSAPTVPILEREPAQPLPAPSDASSLSIPIFEDLADAAEWPGAEEPNTPPGSTTPISTVVRPARPKRSGFRWLLAFLVVVGGVAVSVEQLGPRLDLSLEVPAEPVRLLVSATPSAEPAPSAPLPTLRHGTRGPELDLADTPRKAPLCSALLQTARAAGRLSRTPSPQKALGLMEVADRRGDHDAALLHSCVALEQAGGEPPVQLAHVRSLLHYGDALAALQEVDRLLAGASKPASHWPLLRGDILAALGRFEEAKQVFVDAGKEANQGTPDQIASRSLNAARAQFRRGQIVAAKYGFRRVAVLKPGDLEATTGVAEMLLRSGDPDAAAGWARRCIKMAPQASGPYALLGRALARAGRTTEALGALEQALQRNRADRQLRWDLSRLRAGKEI